MAELLAALSGFHSFTGSFYLRDFFDVLIVAVFFYAALLLFKRTRSLSILGGIGIIVVLYGISQIFNLTLTTTFLRSFFSAFFLVLIIIFQEEIRRFFESVAVLGSRQQKTHTTSSLKSFLLDPIVQATANMASHKMGALMIFTGRENIERHIQGGIYLDSLISQELIESVFDTSSPGHDGAMIITNNRIATIGTQLPLSRNFQEIGRGGTRHAAALGLSEKSDILAVIVSEERGTISVAEKGKLVQLKDIEELSVMLRKFYKDKFPTQTETMWKRVIARNPIEKVVAIVLAGLLWFLLVFQAGNIQRDFEIPITYRDLPEHVIISESEPRSVVVTLQSRGQSFDRVDPNSLQISLDARDFTSGTRTVQITDSMIRRPFGLDVTNINPKEIRLTVNELIPVNLPIEANLIGSPSSGYTVQQVVITPRTLPVLVSDGLERTPLTLKTDPIDISNIRGTVSRTATLSLPQGVRFPNNVAVNVIVTVVVRSR